MEGHIDPDAYYVELEREFWKMHDDEVEDREIQQVIDETGDYPLGHIHNPRRRTESITHHGERISVDICMVYGYGTTRNNPVIDLYIESPEPTDQNQARTILEAALTPLKRTWGNATIDQATLNAHWE